MMPDILEAINSGRITDVDLMPSLARINAHMKRNLVFLKLGRANLVVTRQTKKLTLTFTTRP
jgi:hypothetical protein